MAWCGMALSTSSFRSTFNNEFIDFREVRMSLSLPRRIVPTLLPALLLGAAMASAAAQAPMSAEQQAAHVLNRVAFGPRPGDIERVAKMGVQNYLDEQLHPERIAYPPELTARLAALSTPNRKAGDVLGEFVELQNRCVKTTTAPASAAAPP